MQRLFRCRRRHHYPQPRLRFARPRRQFLPPPSLRRRTSHLLSEHTGCISFVGREHHGLHTFFRRYLTLVLHIDRLSDNHLVLFRYIHVTSQYG